MISSKDKNGQYKDGIFQITQEKLIQRAIHTAIPLILLKEDENTYLNAYFSIKLVKPFVTQKFVYIPSDTIKSFFKPEELADITKWPALLFYSLNLEKIIRDMFDMKKTYNTLRIALAVGKNKNIKSKNDDEVKNSLPFQKEQRLKQIYETLIKFTLSALHTLVNIDLVNDEENPLPVEELLAKLLPSVLKMKIEYEKILLTSELPTDEISKVFY